MADKKITDESVTTITTPDGTEYLPSAKDGDQTAYNIQITKLFYPTITERTTFSRNDLSLTNRVMTIIGNCATTPAGPITQLLIQNTGDVVGGSNYQNEVHLRLQAGTTGNYRKYINFADNTGTDQWVTGSNETHAWILYDRYLHRLWLTQNGASYISSGGTGGIYMNYHGSDTVGTGGFHVYSGGAPANNIELMSVGQTTPPDSTLLINLNAGKDAAQAIQMFWKDRGSNKILLSKDASNNFYAYDSVNSQYIWTYTPSNKNFGVGYSIPFRPLTVGLDSALTNTVYDLIAVTHSSTGTVAAGFGVAFTAYAESTGALNRDMGRISWSWVTATDASRASQGKLSAYYTTTERVAINWQADSSGTLLGFHGVTPIARATLATGTGKTVDDVITALQNLGLVKQS